MKEAYCSFEISKLLKDKGFGKYGESSYAYYSEFDDWKTLRFWRKYARNPINTFYLCAPTHQMACAWLREEYEVYIDIETCYEYTNRNENFKVTGFAFTIHTKDDPCYEDDNSFDSYEEACEAALKYVLENLI